MPGHRLHRDEDDASRCSLLHPTVLISMVTVLVARLLFFECYMGNAIGHKMSSVDSGHLEDATGLGSPGL